MKEAGINFTVFEATRYLGGTWRYDPRVGIDENGLPIHTSMYKPLRYVNKLVNTGNYFLLLESLSLVMLILQSMKDK